MDIAAFVISKNDSGQRESFQTALGENIRVVGCDAIFDIERIESNFDLALSKLVYGRKVRVGERGCTLSHQMAVKKALEFEWDWLIVFEDDAVITAEFFEFINRIPKHDQKMPSAIVLGHSKLDKADTWWHTIKFPLHNVRYSDERFQVGKRDYINYYGTVSYMLNRAAGYRFVNHKSIFWLADDWRIIRHSGIDVFNVCPVVIYEDLSSVSESGNARLALHRMVFGRILKECWVAFRNHIKVWRLRKSS